MGEHKENMTALWAQTLPQFPPAGRDGHGSIGLRCAPKKHIVCIRPEDIREVDGKQQYRATDDGAWQDVPKGAVAHPLGEPLAPENCDVILFLLGVWADLTTTNQHGSPSRVGVHMIPGEFARVDLCAFLRMAEASLGEEKRLISAGLSIVEG